MTRPFQELTNVDQLCFTCPMEECDDKDPRCAWRIAMGLPIRRPRARPSTSVEMDEEIRERYAEGDTSYRKLSHEYGLSHSVIRNIVKKERMRDHVKQLA